MKIAVATDDYVTVTGHVGKCNGFNIYEIENEKVISYEQRENMFTNHKVQVKHDQQHEHTHGGLLEGLKDCSHLICKAAGWRLQDDFMNNDKELVFTDENIAEIAALKLANGSLEQKLDGACHSH